MRDGEGGFIVDGVRLEGGEGKDSQSKDVEADARLLWDKGNRALLYSFREMALWQDDGAQYLVRPSF